MSLVMLIGSLIMKHHANIFFTLKYTMLQKWIITYGIENLLYTWWLIVIIILLCLLSITLIICILKNLNINDPLFHVHLGFVLLLIGLFVSHTLSKISYGNIVTKNTEIKLANTNICLKVSDIKIKFFPNKTHFIGTTGKASGCSVALLIKDKNKIYRKKISLNKPCWYKGFSIFIEDFYPKERSNALPFVNLTIRKDYGIPIMIIGSALFCLGLIGVLVK